MDGSPRPAGRRRPAAPAVPTAPTPANVEVVWLGQSAFKITTPGGKVIVTDPWLLAHPPALPKPLTPAEYPSQFAMFASPTNVACTKYTPTHNPISQ